MEGESTTVQGGLKTLVATRAEHRRILQAILADGGMAMGTRQALVEHLLAEEDEHLARLQALAGADPAGVGGAAAEPPTPPRIGGLTVGSLRPEAALVDARLGSLARVDVGRTGGRPWPAP